MREYQAIHLSQNNSTVSIAKQKQNVIVQKFGTIFLKKCKSCLISLFMTSAPFSRYANYKFTVNNEGAGIL